MSSSELGTEKNEEIVLTEEDHLEVLECARYGEVDDLKYLLSIGCDVNHLDNGGSSALHKAAANGFVEILDVLHVAGARFMANHSGNTPLHFACLTGQSIAVNWLIKNYGSECNVFAKNKVGKSAFTEATSGGHEEIARMLLAHSSAEPSSSLPQSSSEADNDDGFGDDVDDAEDEDIDLINQAEAEAEREKKMQQN